MKTALITGGARGLGKEYARALGHRGYRLILVDVLNEELNDTAAQIEQETGAATESLVVDLSTANGCECVARQIDELESLDVLINNAGIRQRQPFPQDDLVAYRELVEVNITACVHLAWAAMRKMQQQGHGYIANVAAVIGFTPREVNYTMYSSAKQFLINFTRGIHRNARRNGVTVQAVCPGFALVEGTKDESRRRFPRALWMTAEETVAAAIAELESGKCIVIPGRRNRMLLAISRLHLSRPLILGLKLLERLRLLPRWDREDPNTTCSRNHWTLESAALDPARSVETPATPASGDHTKQSPVPLSHD